ncbi:DNA integrity scanning diadenylate cyclase DisA [Nocardia lijiangensis]|uniref:DNA integrity scanning diadenylate cyclase DisA n=1 Tax=Nocardia lijiangensis TaxID=299618 RepID=UPI003D751501
MAAPANRLPEAVTRLAPGTPLRDGLERIQRGRTGGLIVLGYDEGVERLCDGGFELDVEYAPTRLRELSKMDGAVVLSTDGSRILRANVHLVPDPNLPSAESGTRHRAAERTAAQTGHPVVAVSKSMRTVTLYVDDIRHLVEPSATILARANQALGTLERYKARLDQVCEQLSESEIEDVVTLREALTAAQRLELVRRLANEIEQNVLELGADGRQLALQLEDLVGDSTWLRELLIRDYLAAEPAASAEVAGAGVPAHGVVPRTRTRQRENTACSCAGRRHVHVSEVECAMASLDLLTDAELLDLTNLAAPLGYPSTLEALDLPMRPRGYRVLTRIPRLRFTHIESLVDSFGSLQGLLVATASDLQSVDGIGVPRARQIREGLTRLAEADLDDSFAADR